MLNYCATLNWTDWSVTEKSGEQTYKQTCVDYKKKIFIINKQINLNLKQIV